MEDQNIKKNMPNTCTAEDAWDKKILSTSNKIIRFTTEILKVNT